MNQIGRVGMMRCVACRSSFFVRGRGSFPPACLVCLTASPPSFVHPTQRLVSHVLLLSSTLLYLHSTSGRPLVLLLQTDRPPSRYRISPLPHIYTLLPPNLGRLLLPLELVGQAHRVRPPAAALVARGLGDVLPLRGVWIGLRCGHSLGDFEGSATMI